MTNPWRTVVFASGLPICEMCDEPWCPECREHYADCSCPGPDQDDIYEYAIIGGVTLCARLKEEICNEAASTADSDSRSRVPTAGAAARSGARSTTSNSAGGRARPAATGKRRGNNHVRR